MQIDRENEMAYFAGIFDGDGSFSLGKKAPRGAERSALYYPYIQLSTTSFGLIEMLLAKFGGYVTERKSYVAKDGSRRKASRRWTIDKAPRCFPFLEAISKYIIIKKDRVDFLVDYIKNNPFKRGSVKISDEIMGMRDRSYIKMKEMNACKKVFDLRIPRHRKMSEDNIFWHYFAGLMDTDGSFSIKRESTGYYAPSILLTMVDARAFTYILRNCDIGRIISVKAKGTRTGSCYRLGFYSVKECKRLLEIVMPFLRIKKEQASILLDYCNKRSEAPKLSSEESDIWYAKLKECNKYGVYKPSLIDLEPLTGDAEGNKAEGSNATVNVASEKAPLIKGDAVL